MPAEVKDVSRLRQMRLNLDLRTGDIASATGLDDSQIYRFETGNARILPEPEVLSRYAEVLNVTVEKLEHAIRESAQQKEKKLEQGSEGIKLQRHVALWLCKEAGGVNKKINVEASDITKALSREGISVTDGAVRVALSKLVRTKRIYTVSDHYTQRAGAVYRISPKGWDFAHGLGDQESAKSEEAEVNKEYSVETSWNWFSGSEQARYLAEEAIDIIVETGQVQPEITEQVLEDKETVTLPDTNERPLPEKIREVDIVYTATNQKDKRLVAVERERVSPLTQEQFNNHLIDLIDAARNQEFTQGVVERMSKEINTQKESIAILGESCMEMAEKLKSFQDGSHYTQEHWVALQGVFEMLSTVSKVITEGGPMAGILRQILPVEEQTLVFLENNLLEIMDHYEKGYKNNATAS